VGERRKDRRNVSLGHADWPMSVERPTLSIISLPTPSWGYQPEEVVICMMIYLRCHSVVASKNVYEI
jgi:hypothetical protein